MPLKITGRSMLGGQYSRMIIREVPRTKWIHNYNSKDEFANKKDHGNKGNKRSVKFEDSYWVPHPKTGIYYPKGYEWVMEDVPKGSSLFPQTYWLRSLEGVDDPSTPIDHLLRTM